MKKGKRERKKKASTHQECQQVNNCLTESWDLIYENCAALCPEEDNEASIKLCS